MTTNDRDPRSGGEEATHRAVWAAGYGTAPSAIPAACRLWAATVMLADLEPRYRTPRALTPVRRAIERWTVG